MHTNYAPPIPPRKRRTGRIVAAGLLTLVAVLCGIGAVRALSPGGEQPGIGAAERAVVSGQATDTAEPADNPPAAELELTAKDVTLQAKIASQHCFGSAGCNTDIDVKAGWPDGFTGTYEVAYTMTIPGDSSVSDTVTLYAESGKYDRPVTASCSPAHAVTAKTVKIHVDSVERLS